MGSLDDGGSMEFSRARLKRSLGWTVLLFIDGSNAGVVPSGGLWQLCPVEGCPPLPAIPIVWFEAELPPGGANETVSSEPF